MSPMKPLNILLDVILHVLFETLADDTFEFRFDDLLCRLRARVDDIVEDSVHVRSRIVRGGK